MINFEKINALLWTTDTTKPVSESESNFRITINVPYLALMGELWGVIVRIFFLEN